MFSDIHTFFWGLLSHQFLLMSFDLGSGVLLHNRLAYKKPGKNARKGEVPFSYILMYTNKFI